VFVDSPALGWLFERKLHFAFGAMALAWCALALLTAAALAARPAPAPSAAAPPRRIPAWTRDLERAGQAALAGSTALAALAAILAAVVAGRYPF
jgi:ABC-type phosphate transport system substrate-binding protein